MRRGGRVSFTAPDAQKGPLRPRARLDVSWELRVDDDVGSVVGVPSAVPRRRADQ